MKHISIMFVAALSLAAVAGGCKKKGGGDCSTAISGAMDRTMAEGMKEMKDMPPEQKKMAEDMAKQMMPKMTVAMTKSCVDDKWSAEAIKCFDDGKTQADLEGCESKLSAEQKASMEKAMSAAMGMGDDQKMGGDDHKMGGDDHKMGGDKPAEAPAAGSGSAAAGSAAPAAAGGGDLPPECADYKAAVEKLATCDKMPQASKDALKQGFDAMSQSWANLAGMPADAKAAMASGCKSGADALKQTGSTVCGW